MYYGIYPLSASMLSKKIIMPQSLSKVYIHSIFGTKCRRNLIVPKIETDLYAYIGGIITNIGGVPLQINGMPDHVHVLSTLQRTITIAKYIEVIKTGSSKWIKTQDDVFKDFAWQNGYSVFSVNSRGVDVVSRYIANQKEHHRKFTSQQEVIQFLEEYSVEYDERYLWD